VRSFVRRTGRVTTGQAKAFAELGSTFVLPFQTAPLDMVAAFGRSAPVILEIGFGMGEATAHIAQVRPDDNFLCCEVHEPGVGALLKRIGEHKLDNIRILQHDAVEVLAHMLPEGSLQGIHVFFPDPWHKKKHNKRRLIQAPFLAKLVSRLAQGAIFIARPIGNPTRSKCLKCSVLNPNCATAPTALRRAPATVPPPNLKNAACAWAMGCGMLFF
jgi:tRNA (guanine-N7-)-methyltransferase